MDAGAARSEADLLASAGRGDTAAFDRLVAPHRRELYAHCYRMLGAVHDAEDALQDSLLEAWRGLAGFEGRSSLRTWLYRVTTNACLRQIARRSRRLRSQDLGAPWRDTGDLGEPVAGPVWLEPWPDDEPEGTDADADPRRALRPAGERGAGLRRGAAAPAGTQRAALMLQMCSGSLRPRWPASSTRRPPRSTARSSAPGRRSTGGSPAPHSSRARALGPGGRRELVDAFVTAWERADLPALLDLLARDAQFTMPPLPAWFDGRDDVARFFTQRVFALQWRLVPLPLNGQLGFVCYSREPGAERFTLGAVNVLTVRGGRIAGSPAFSIRTCTAGWVFRQSR